MKKQEQSYRHKKRIRRKWTYSVSAIVGGLLLLLHVALLYFAEPLLKNILTEFVRNESDGLYELEFEDIVIDLSSSSVELYDLKLRLDTARYEVLRKQRPVEGSVFAIHLPEVNLKGVNLYKIYTDRELFVSSVRFRKPQITLMGDFLKNSKQLQDRVIYHDLYPVVSQYLQAINIDQIEVQDGFFGLYKGGAYEVHQSKAERISVILKGFYLDEQRFLNNQNIFFSDEVNVHLENYVLSLNDSLHIFRANQIELSSLAEQITAKGVSLEPRYGEFQEDTVQQDLYEAWLAELKVSGADLNKAHFQKELEIDFMEFRHPFIKLINFPAKQAEEKKQYEVKTDLYNLIKGHLKEVLVHNFELTGGTFHQVSYQSVNDPVMELDDLSISFEAFQLDSLSSQDMSRVLHAKNIEVSLGEYRMELPDSVHTLKADKLSVSTKRKSLVAESIQLEPKEGADSLAHVKGYTLYAIEVPGVTLSGVDLSKAYHRKVLPIEKLEIRDPKMNFTAYAKSEKPQEADSSSIEPKNDLYGLTSPFLHTILIDTLSLEKGALNLKSIRPNGKQAFANGTFAFDLYQFRLDSTARLAHNKVFFADDIQVRLSDYAVKLADDLHVLKADLIEVSTRNSEVRAKGLSLVPLPYTNRKQLLRQYGKSVLIEAHVPELVINKANIHKAYYQKELSVEQIKVTDPRVKLVNYRDLKARKFKMMPKDEVYELISAYLETIHIGQMKLIDGDFDVITGKSGSLNNLSRNNVSVDVSNFVMDERLLKSKNQLFDAEEVHIKLKDYVLNLPDSLHQVQAGAIDFNLKGPDIIAKNVRLYPKENYSPAFYSKQHWYLEVPEIRMLGIDVDKAFEEKVLEIDSFSILKPEMKLLTLRDSIPLANGEKKNLLNRKKGLPKALDFIFIKHLDLEEGIMRFANDLQGNEQVYSTANIAMNFSNLEFSGQKGNPEVDIYADEIELKLYDYFLRLPDSTHHFKADTLFLSTINSSLFLKKARLYPANKKEALKLLEDGERSYLIHAAVPYTEVSGLNFNKLYTSQKLEVDDLRLQDPLFEIYQANPLKNRQKRKAWPSKSPKNLSPYLESIEIDSSKISNGRFVLHKQFDKKRAPLKIDRLFGQVIHFKLDTSAIDPDRFFFSDDVRLEVRDYAYNLPDSLYTLKADKIGVSTAERLVYADSLRLDPRYYRYLFAQVVGHQVDRADVKTHQVRLENADIKELLYQQNVKADRLLLDGLEANFFRDKRLPKKEAKRKLFPQESFRKLKFKVDIDTVIARESLISIEERVEKSIGTGKVTFEDLYITLAPLTNHPEKLEKGTTTQVVGTGRLMGKGRVEADLSIPLNDPKNSFLFEGRLVEEMPLNEINPILENVAFITIRKGTAKSIDFRMEADEDSARGEMRFRYHNLRIGLIDKKTGKEKGIGESFKALLANMFVLRRHNPNRALQLRVGEIHHDRDKTKSMYHYWWKALFSGFKSTFGIDKEAYKELIETEEDKQE